ncbi:hypothetical protein CN072_26670 [Sinorhizobium meliloti]|uniref:CCE_0567 family metalloprotein n=1 Tax=Rhizobium meliloti TaxID=382 RepID=UPI000FD2B417|nr:CCE_0567 family metalloprotein [Sinorhizobium meliloti]RVP80830.1 hypothetical protein CN072_26670 [Sinorhizobium meliloti]
MRSQCANSSIFGMKGKRTAMMELHDLAEDLPSKWTEIMAVAEKTFRAFAELDAVKRELAESENAQ